MGRELHMLFKSDMVYCNDRMYGLQFSMDFDDLVIREDKFILVIKRELTANHSIFARH